jgi:hypothetical protein
MVQAVPGAVAGLALLPSTSASGLTRVTSPDKRVNSTVALSFISEQTSLIAKYHGDGISAADIRAASITAGMFDAELTRTSMYAEIDASIQADRSLIMGIDMANIDPTPMLKKINSLAKAVGVTPALEMSDLEPLFSQGDYSHAKAALLGRSSSTLIPAYVKSLNSWEANLGQGILASSFRPGISRPYLRPVRFCAFAAMSAGYALLAAAAIICPECDVVLVSAGAITITAGGTAATLSAIEGLAASFEC